MKWSSPILVVLASGCVHASAKPESVSAFVEQSVRGCGLIAPDRSVLLTVHNDGPGKLRVSAQYESAPPFRMGWPYYSILSAKTDPPAIYKQPMGHANLPIAHVSIGPGDTTQFLLYVGEFTPVSEELRYRVQFEDEDGQIHFSSPFSLCVPGSMPNISSRDFPSTPGE